MLIAATENYRRDLGDGLILRWSTADDTEKIVHLTSLVFRSSADEPPNVGTKNIVRRLMRGDSPLMGPGDYGIVEDTSKEGHPVVACTCLWRQNWAYEGIPFQIGRPEVVASDATYRHRGLIRALFEMVHARSESEGHLVQAITGIPYFYRQFGYEYALDLGGRRATYLSLIPRLKEGVVEPYTLREAVIEDIPLIQEFYHRRQHSSIVWTPVPDSYWRYEIEAWKTHPEMGRTSIIQMILDVQGSVKGFVMMAPERWGRAFNVWLLEVAAGVNLQAMMPSILRALQAYGAQVPTNKLDTEAMSEICFVLGRTHPVYDVLGDALAPFYDPPYAWYVRVPNLPAFLKLIAPALEKRLEDSVVAGYSGELKLDFYRGGLRMVFEEGRLTVAENWRVPTYDSNAGAGFAPLVFLQLLFGHRSLDELRYAFPEVRANQDTAVVLKALFPTRPSLALPL